MFSAKPEKVRKAQITVQPNFQTMRLIFALLLTPLALADQFLIFGDQNRLSRQCDKAGVLSCRRVS